MKWFVIYVLGGAAICVAAYEIGGEGLANNVAGALVLAFITLGIAAIAVEADRK